MENIDRLKELGLFNARVPRYTSYPPAPVFSPAAGADFQESCLRALDTEKPVSVYLHVPFCERLCWFCACHTQGTRTLTPIERYISAVEAELARVRDCLPAGVRMRHLHWGGGTPTILSPELIDRLRAAIGATFEATADFEFSVETDPTMIDVAKVEALRFAGMTRASIGVQDFDPAVQKAIGRPQSLADTRACVDNMRRAGVASINIDLVYGLPHQTPMRFDKTVASVIDLAPTRVALFGYAHVPHMSKRQRMIDQGALPDDTDRYRLAASAREAFLAAGFHPIGIDHFARPGDPLLEAARRGRLRRNFQGYTTDACDTLVGMGASSISRFAQGYVQNAHATAAYQSRVGSGDLAGARGHMFSGEDLLRARAIEQLLCDFRINQIELVREFGNAAQLLTPIHAEIAAKYDGLVRLTEAGLEVLDAGRPLVRLMAWQYDAYADTAAGYSKAS